MITKMPFSVAAAMVMVNAKRATERGGAVCSTEDTTIQQETAANARALAFARGAEAVG